MISLGFLVFGFKSSMMVEMLASPCICVGMFFDFQLESFVFWSNMLCHLHWRIASCVTVVSPSMMYRSDVMLMFVAQYDINLVSLLSLLCNSSSTELLSGCLGLLLLGLSYRLPIGSIDTYWVGMINIVALQPRKQSGSFFRWACDSSGFLFRTMWID